MWGEKPTDNAYDVLELMQKRNIKNVLIPGFGYGRNAKVMYDQGVAVTGIEISKSAIERARKYFKSSVNIYHGSVANMPYDDKKYQAVYCYSLLHLLDISERQKLIHDCYAQLETGGVMVFVALSTSDTRFGVGQEIEKNTFHSPQGLNLYFYDEKMIREAFGPYNILDVKEIGEPKANPTEIHWMVVCEKSDHDKEK